MLQQGLPIRAVSRELGQSHLWDATRGGGFTVS